MPSVASHESLRILLRRIQTDDAEGVVELLCTAPDSVWCFEENGVRYAVSDLIGRSIGSIPYTEISYVYALRVNNARVIDLVTSKGKIRLFPVVDTGIHEQIRKIRRLMRQSVRS